jgi:hypothetical protein
LAGAREVEGVEVHLLWVGDIVYFFNAWVGHGGWWVVCWVGGARLQVGLVCLWSSVVIVVFDQLVLALCVCRISIYEAVGGKSGGCGMRSELESQANVVKSKPNPIDFQSGGQVRDQSTVQLLHRLVDQRYSIISGTYDRKTSTTINPTRHDSTIRNLTTNRIGAKTYARKDKSTVKPIQYIIIRSV